MFLQVPTEKRTLLQRMGSLRRSTRKRDKPLPLGGTGIAISGPTLLDSQAMTDRMQRLGCVDIGSTSRNDDVFNNNTKGSDLMHIGGNRCICDGCSNTDSTIIEYLLPDDYVMGTFPKQLLESQVRISRRNSVSSRLADTNCCHARSRADQQQTGSNPTLSSQPAKRNSFYDNLPCEDTPPSTPEPLAPETETITARKELDAVLQDLLVDINRLERSIDDSVSDSMIFGLPQSDHSGSTDHLNVDSAVVSPTSEVLSSLTDTPSDTVNTPLDTPKLPRSSQETTSGSSEELAVKSASHNELNNCVNGYGHETVWRERRDSGVGSSLTREPL